MDPKALHSAPDVKPFPTASPEGSDSDSQDDDLNEDEDSSERFTDKRPRLRLAHACDRCRKRKIRCDTEQPCGPCKATSNQCTFHAPPRRTVSKPKPPVPGARPGGGPGGGIKRPHSPSRTASSGIQGASASRLFGLGNGNANGDPQHQANLEARLAALEAMLGEVPPNVHNALMTSMDERLGGRSTTNGLNGLSDVKDESDGVQGLSSGSGGAFGIGRLSNPWLNQMLGASMNPLERRRMSGSGDVNSIADKIGGMSFFYEDEIGQAKWQGATSGFPLLDALTAVNMDTSIGLSANPNSTAPAVPPPSLGDRRCSSSQSEPFWNRSPGGASTSSQATTRFFPDRTPRPHQTLNPEASWRVITGVIPPDLMDTLVRCYLSTSHLLWPFLHVPSFLADYANPQQWGEPGFACFIVAVCTLSSRHVDDPRVRANPQDPSTAGKNYFELFKRLRDLPSADRPTLYSIQAAFLAAVYAFGLGNLSKAFALQAESITLCLDGGLHRSVDGYDHFDAIEKETRKRTFWSIYSWDKQSAALFGRPPIILLRVCDTPEPLVVDDENLTREGIKEGSSQANSRMEAFVAAIRLHVVLEGVLDISSRASSFPPNSFLAQAASYLCQKSPQSENLENEEALLEEWIRVLPRYWVYDTETANSRDPIRITQAERLHCLEHLVKMLIHRHRFSGFLTGPAVTGEERSRQIELCRKAMQCALTIIADHVHISQRGMMTYYGVHVIHQLAQAGRTLVAVILNCRNADFRPLISPCIEGLRSCVGLLRRFSGRYLCGLRSADIIDEFCRICNIPVDLPRVPDGTGRSPPAWLRPVRKRTSPSPFPDRPSPDQTMNNAYTGVSPPPDFTGDIMSNPTVTGDNRVSGNGDMDAMFNTSEYFTLSPSSPNNDLGPQSVSASLMDAHAGSSTSQQTPQQLPLSEFLSQSFGQTPEWTANLFSNGNGQDAGQGRNGMNGFGGELLAGEGMDTVSDGLRNGGEQVLSAATILSLLEEGSFDYGSIFTDQAPAPVTSEIVGNDAVAEESEEDGV